MTNHNFDSAGESPPPWQGLLLARVLSWHKSEVQTGSEIVRFSRKTGSEQRIAKMTRLALNGNGVMSDLSPLSGVKRKTFARIELCRF